MRLPQYAAYVDSGEPWMGVVPEHWQVRRLKNLFEIRKRIVGEEGHQVLSITQRGIRIKDIESNDGQLSMDYSKYQIVQPGDFAMNHMDLLTGYVDISPYSGVTSPDYRVFVLRDGIICEPKYFLFLLQNAYRQRIFYALGQGASEFGRWRLPADQFNDFRVPFPPLGEQGLISAFLDREISKIDTLIAEQEKLLALLAEKRQATISHAVTKGLNTDVPMKNSGVDWFGDVPEHWPILPAKRCASVFVPQRNKPELNVVGSGTYWATMEDMKKGHITSTNFWVSDEARLEAGSRILRAGAVIASCVGNFGVASINDVDIVVNQQLQAFISTPSINNKFLCYIVLISRTYFERIGTTATLVYVNQQGFENMPTLLPPISEQLAIVEFLDIKIAELDLVCNRATQVISCLNERRSALIAAAVTGQIDVRDAVAEVSPA